MITTYSYFISVPLSYFTLSIAIVFPMRRKYISIPISMHSACFHCCEYTSIPSLSASPSLYHSIFHTQHTLMMVFFQKQYKISLNCESLAYATIKFYCTTNESSGKGKHSFIYWIVLSALYNHLQGNFYIHTKMSILFCYNEYCSYILRVRAI